MNHRGGDRRAKHVHRRRTIQAILAFALAAPGPPSRAQVGTRVDAPPRATRRPRLHALPPAVDLAADAAASRARRVPILLMFDREDCPYCDARCASTSCR
jgi:hypothetical protein